MIISSFSTDSCFEKTVIFICDFCCFLSKGSGTSRPDSPHVLILPDPTSPLHLTLTCLRCSKTLSVHRDVMTIKCINICKAPRALPTLFYFGVVTKHITCFPLFPKAWTPHEREKRWPRIWIWILSLQELYHIKINI